MWTLALRFYYEFVHFCGQLSVLACRHFVRFCGHRLCCLIIVLSTLVDTCGGLLWFVHLSGHGVFVRIIAM